MKQRTVNQAHTEQAESIVADSVPTTTTISPTAMRERLQELLKEEILIIRYRKKDGTVKTTLATLKPEMLPKKPEEVFAEAVAKAKKGLDATEWGVFVEAEEKFQQHLANKPVPESKETPYMTYWDVKDIGFRMFKPEDVICFEII